MVFDLTISLGNLLVLLGFIISVLVSWVAVVRRFDRLEYKVSLMWKQFARRFELPENGD